MTTNESESASGEQIGNLGAALRSCQEDFARNFGDPPAGMIAASVSVGQPSRCLVVSDFFCRQTGYSWQQMNGKDLLGIIHPEDQPALDTLIDGIATGSGNQFSNDARIVGADGNVIVTRLHGNAIRRADGIVYLAIFLLDITETARMHAATVQLEDELARSRRRENLGQLAEGIAHDFNNLLTVISSYAGLVHDEIAVAEASQGTSRWGPVRWDMRQIEDATDRANRLVKHLMAFTRRETAEPVVANPGELVSDATTLLDEILGEQIMISTQPARALWQVNVDPGMLRQALINIALNARDAMPAGGSLDITVANIDTGDVAPFPVDFGPADTSELAEMLPGRYVVIRVADTGTGMEPVVAERAFEPFFSTKSDDDSAGLGLSAVSRFIARSGGRAWLTSQAGRGTTVTLILPAAPGSSATSPDLVRASQESSLGSIVVVDDEPAIRDVAHRVLTSAGYRVVTAASGPHALALLADQDVRADVMLADVVMPGITAREFLIRVKGLRPDLKVVFMSGYERPDDARTWPDPETEVIAKPFTRATLLVRIQRAMLADAGQAQRAPSADTGSARQAPAADAERHRR